MNIKCIQPRVSIHRSQIINNLLMTSSHGQRETMIWNMDTELYLRERDKIKITIMIIITRIRDQSVNKLTIQRVVPPHDCLEPPHAGKSSSETL